MDTTYTLEDALTFVDRVRNSVEIMNQIEFSDSPSVPEINIYPDDRQFYSPSAGEIHIGVEGILKLFEVPNDEMFFAALNYVCGHEWQHVHSTVPKIYALAIAKGMEAVVEYIQFKEEGYKRKFRKTSDYEACVNDLNEKGIYLSTTMLSKLIGGIANSIEDGREERIRSNRLPGFANLCIIHRGYFWDNANLEFPAYADVQSKPTTKLSIIMNEILSLSTCQLYNKGFVVAYGNTPLIDEVKSFMPDIAAGVMSGRTRGIIAPVTNISKKLAPYIYEACKVSKEDAEARREFEKLLKELVDKILDQIDKEGGLGEAEEDTDDGAPGSVFPVSDLLDALNENAQKSNAKSGSEQGDKKNSGSSNDEQEDTNNESQNAEDKNDSSSIGEKENSQKKSSESQKEIESGSSEKEREKKRVEKNICDEAQKAVIEAMKEAATQTRAEIEANVSHINAATAKAKSHASIKEHVDKSAPISAEEMREICSFRENHREYKVITNLPPALAQRGKSLRRKNEQYFRSLSSPTITYLDSGGVDPSRIYGLAMGDTEIFRKKGQDKKFDGCAYILIDNSGSMSGIKRQEACKAAAVIEESFKGLFPFKIVAFDYSGCVMHEVIKNWDEVLSKNCCWNFCLHGRTGYGNEDGYDIQVAEKELLSRPESKKLLIVLSDGAPGDITGCHNAIEHARKAGIQVNGIYFEEGSYRDDKTFVYMYSKDYICCELKELDANLNKIMKKFSRS